MIVAVMMNAILLMNIAILRIIQLKGHVFIKISFLGYIPRLQIDPLFSAGERVTTVIYDQNDQILS